MRWFTVIACLFLCLATSTASRAAAPDTEKFLLEGQLTEGAAALAKHLEATPGDDQARFGLGVTQFLQAYEHVGQSLYRHGLRTERSFVRPSPEIRKLWPQNPKPE